jgi:hypothetical protein
MKAKSKVDFNLCIRPTYSVHEWAKIGPEPIWLRFAGCANNIGMAKGLLIPVHVDEGLAR